MALGLVLIGRSQGLSVPIWRDMDTKTCSKCGETKPLDEYHRRNKNQDGRHARCKACVKAYAAEWYSQNRETLLAHKAEYYSQNRDAVRAHKAEYYSQNRDAILAQNAEYYQRNPHLRWEYDYRHRARAYGFDPRVVSFTREELIEAHGDRCVHCGGPFEHLDHYVTPVRSGGAHTLENCRPACARCNSSRNQYYEGAAFGRT